MKQNWTYKKLGEVVAITMGQSPASDTYNESEGLPFFQGNADFGKEHPSVRIYCNSPIRIADSGDILISVRAPIGAINIADRKCCIGRGLAAIRGNEKIQSRFIYYLLLASKDKLVAQGTGSTFKSIGKDALYNLLMPSVSLATQSRIVSELDLLQSLIDKQKAQLKELDTLAQSIFYDMFGDPVENEKGWEVKKLKYLSSLITNGTTPKGGAEVYVDDGILFLRSQNVWRNRIEYDDIAHIDAKTNAKMYKSVLHHNDILITKTGRINTENSSLGRAALFTGQTGTANINGHVYLIRLLDGVSHIFIIQILTSQAYREYIRKVCVGGIDKRQINKEQVDDFPIILPPLSLQQSYANKIEAIEKQKSAISKSIAETEKLFEYTMDKYFG